MIMLYLTIVNKTYVTVNFGWHDSTYVITTSWSMCYWLLLYMDTITIYVLKKVILLKQRMHRRTKIRVCKFSGPDKLVSVI